MIEDLNFEINYLPNKFHFSLLNYYIVLCSTLFYEVRDLMGSTDPPFWWGREIKEIEVMR